MLSAVLIVALWPLGKMPAVIDIDINLRLIGSPFISAVVTSAEYLATRIEFWTKNGKSNGILSFAKAGNILYHKTLQSSRVTRLRVVMYFLTIIHWQSIPVHLRRQVGDRLRSLIQKVTHGTSSLKMVRTAVLVLVHINNSIDKYSLWSSPTTVLWYSTVILYASIYTVMKSDLVMDLMLL